MNPPRLAGLIVITAVLAASLAGCTGGGTSPSTTATSEPATPSLTKDTIPTEVGTKWTMVRKDEEGTPLTLTVKGPWEVQAGSDWSASEYEIVDPTTVPGIDDFEDYTFVQRVQSAAGDPYYYPRKVTDEWVLGMGRIQSTASGPKTEPSPPAPFWPLNLEVGKSYTVLDTDRAKTVATVLAHNTATLPAGTLKDAYLTRFRTEYKAGDQETKDTYYLFAPDVGMAAYFSQLVGDEETGFTSAGSIVVLASMPE